MSRPAPTPTPKRIRRARGPVHGKRQLDPLDDGIPTITTDYDGDPVTVYVSPMTTRTDEDGDPTSTRFRTLSTLRSSRTRTSSSMTDTDTDTLGGGAFPTGTSTSTDDDDDDDYTSTSSSTTSTTSSTDTDDLLTSTSSTSSTTSSSSSSSSRTRSSSSNTRSLTSSTSAFLSDTSLPSTALPSDTSTPSPTGGSGSSNHTGAIAGGVVGGVVGLIVVATIVALLFMGARKKRRNQMAPEMAQQTHYDYPSSMYASPSNPPPSSPFGAAATNYHEAPAMHSVVPDVAPPAAAAGLAGTGAGAAAVTRRSGATRQRSGASRAAPLAPERGTSGDHMAAAADEAIGVSASSPVRSTHSPAYESPMSSPQRRRLSQEARTEARPDVYQQADPNMWPSSYMDGWIAGENPYAAAGVSHHTDDPPPPMAFHMRPANASAGGSALSPVGAFTHQPTFADTHGSTNAAQRQSRA